jgi:hypothetical protein
MTAMKVFQSQAQLPNLLSTISLLFLITASAAEETGICKPSTWLAADLGRPMSTPTVWKRNKESLIVANIGKVQTGQINCRYPGGTYDDVDSNSEGKIKRDKTNCTILRREVTRMDLYNLGFLGDR